ncbi:hypothetical protein RYX56_16815 [Alkalihalophilus lindianensis]|uniref:HEAT repeat domain-containing protein n=1 Tax=Alkalihalophilus lindianensis TaxID=1630542 RepID=A0ABU3XDS4_9BACI|nr:hypothetical protein [Alkalihalophilus lindianensis]MDV2686032.1 hypothetical protein [Alkalihalophilus lindianensis]
MNPTIQRYFTDLESPDKQAQYEAYQHLIEATRTEVDWAYEVWDQLKEDLTNKDAHKRSRAAQFLSHLAISDLEKRIIDDFPKVWAVTKDPKFVTARHSLQSIWRIALAGAEQKQLVMTHLVDRFKNCLDEKNYTLIRFDIQQNFRHLFDQSGDEKLKQLAIELIELEEKAKYQKKYKTVWR